MSAYAGLQPVNELANCGIGSSHPAKHCNCYVCCSPMRIIRTPELIKTLVFRVSKKAKVWLQADACREAVHSPEAAYGNLASHAEGQVLSESFASG